MIAPEREEVIYPYHDADGVPKYEVIRRPGKVFLQRQLDGHGGHSWNMDGVERLPYRLSQLLKHRAKGHILFVVEGEKDADRLARLGLCATTSAGGAGWKWTPEFVEHFRGFARIAVLTDCDDAGRKAAKERARLLSTVCNDVRLIDFDSSRNDHFDVSDWLDKGHTHEELSVRVETAAAFALEPEPGPLRSPVAPKEPWPELIREIDPEPLPLAMPEDLIPEPLRRRVVDICERMCVPAEMVVAPMVVAVAAIVGRTVGIRPRRRDDWLVVPNLWGGVVARPGHLKSPVIAEALKPLSRLAVRAHEQFVHERDHAVEGAVIAKLEVAVLESQLKSAMKKASDEYEIAALREKLAAKRIELKSVPTERRYVTHDATIEKLGELLGENPRGLLQMRDELVGWLRLMDRSGHEGDRAFYLEAWNGIGAFTFDRIARGTIHIPALTLSAFGGITPGALRSYIAEAMAGARGADGLLQRIQVVVWPGAMPEWKNVDRQPDAAARDRVFAIFERLDALAPDRIGARCDDSEIPYLRFSPEGQTLFDAWRDALECRLHSDDLRDRPAFESHLAKYRSLMPSLALLFHLIDVVDGGEMEAGVSLTAARQAASWCDYLETHAERVYASETPRSAAGALAKHIERGDVHQGDDVRTIYRHCWSRLDTAESASEAVRILETLGWLRLVEPPSTGGRPASPTIEMHPDLGVDQ
jgi:5S rRNA maturation endonuclease (ribonuclease M5)